MNDLSVMIAFRCTEQDRADLDRLERELGQAARRDGLPNGSGRGWAIRTAIKTLLADFDRQTPAKKTLAKKKRA